MAFTYKTSILHRCHRSVHSLAPGRYGGNFNTLRPRRNEQHFAAVIFKRIFFNENVWISIKISLKFVPKGPINNIPALVRIMAWRRSGDKPLSEPMMVSLPTHICVIRPRWVNSVISEHMLQIKFMNTSGEIVIIWIPQINLDHKSTLVQVMASCCQTRSHYLHQNWTNPCWNMASLGHIEHHIWFHQQV